MADLRQNLVRRDYPGLNDAEDTLLRRYLLDQDRNPNRIETQVRVGPGELLPDDQPDAFRRSWQESSKFKIDAVIHYDGEIEIVELKDFIRSSHLGQLLSYRYWFDLERSPDDPVTPVVTAPDINPTAVQPTTFHGVDIHVQSRDGRVHLEQGQAANPPF